VEYDANLVNGSELLDLLQACGLHAKLAPLGKKRSPCRRSAIVVSPG
jgi:hypothetical protein